MALDSEGRSELGRSPPREEAGVFDWAQSQVHGIMAQSFAYPTGASAIIYAFQVPLLVATHVVMLYWLITHRSRRVRE